MFPGVTCAWAVPGFHWIMDLSHLPVKIRARYGDLAQTFDRRSPEDAGGDMLEQPVPHIPFLFAKRRFPKRDKKAASLS